MSYYGYIDMDGNILFEIDDAYTSQARFYNGRAVISKREGYGYKAYLIDTSGNTLKILGDTVYFQYGFTDGVAPVIIGPGVGAIDLNGYWIVEPEYANIIYYDGVITAKTYESQYVYFDKQGNKLWECGYPCTYVNDGYLFMLKDEKFFMLDSKGNEIMELPEGYMPARHDLGEEWNVWRERHKDND